MSTLEHQDKLLLSYDTFIFKKQDELLLAKARKRTLSKQNLEFRKLHFFDLLGPKSSVKNLNFTTYKDPLFKVFQYELSEPIFKESMDLSLLVEKQSSDIFFLPGRLSKESHIDNQQSPYGAVFKSSFSLKEDQKFEFQYSGKFIAFNGFFGFLLDEKIQVDQEIQIEQKKANLEGLKKGGILDQAKNLLSDYWSDRTHYFSLNQTKIFFMKKDNWMEF